MKHRLSVAIACLVVLHIAAISADAQDWYPSLAPGTGIELDLDELRQLPIRDYRSITSLQPGTIVDRRTGDIHVRGGDPNDLGYYLHPFVSLRNEFTGDTRQVLGLNILSRLQFNSGAGSSVTSNGAGGISVVTPGIDESNIHGVAEAITDNFHGDNYDYNLYSLSLYGGLSDNLSFWATLERQWSNSGRWNGQGAITWNPSDRWDITLGGSHSEADWQSVPRSYFFNSDHAPRVTDRDDIIWGSALFGINDKSSLRLTVDRHKVENKTGDGVYFDDIWGYGRPGDGNPYDDNTGLFYSWDDLALDLDGAQMVTPSYDSTLSVPMWIDQNYNGEVDDREPFYLDGKARDISFTYNFTRIDTVDNLTFTRRFADEGHVWDDYSTYQWETTGLKLDHQWRPNRRLEFQSGISYRAHTARYYRHYFPTLIYQGAQGGFLDIDSYGYNVLGEVSDTDQGLNGAKKPTDAGGYIDGQHLIGRRVTLSGGVRIDRYDNDAKLLRDPRNPLDPDGYADPEITPDPTEEQLLEAQQLTEADLSYSESKTTTSPWLAVTIDASRNTAVHGAFQRSHKRPNLRDLYVNYDFLEYKVKTGGYYAPFGNPDLEPVQNTLFELGVSHRFSNRVSGNVVGFMKDVDNLVHLLNQPAQPTNFTTYASDGTVNVKGLELSLRLRAGDARGPNGYPAHVTVGYTLQEATGNGRFINTQRNVAWTVSEPPPQPGVPLPYDRTHTLVVDVDYRIERDQGLQIGRFHPFENSGLNVLFRAESGMPYTPSRTYNEITLGNASPVAIGEVGSERIPALYRLDLKANKTFDLLGRSLDIYFWILNIFDRDNVIDVYTGSGLPDDTKWLETIDGRAFTENNQAPTDNSGLTGEEKYHLSEADPANYDTPRQIRVGARLMF